MALSTRSPSAAPSPTPSSETGTATTASECATNADGHVTYNKSKQGYKAVEQSRTQRQQAQGRRRRQVRRLLVGEVRGVLKRASPRSTRPEAGRGSAYAAATHYFGAAKYVRAGRRRQPGQTASCEPPRSSSTRTAWPRTRPATATTSSSPRDGDGRRRRYRGLPRPLEDRGVLQGHEERPGRSRPVYVSRRGAHRGTS